MAKKKAADTKTKGNAHGKQHPMNMGNVGRSTQMSEDGRARKRAERVLAERAREQKRAEDERRIMAGASVNLEHLRYGVVGERIRVRLWKEGRNPLPFTSFGDIVVEISENDDDKPVMHVIASTFDAIPARKDVFLPHNCIGRSNLLQFVPDEAFAWQCELWQALQWKLGSEPMPVMRPRAPQFGGQLPMKKKGNEVAEEAVVKEVEYSQPASTVNAEELIAKSEKLSVFHFAEKWRGNPNFTKNFLIGGTENDFAIFRREVVCGARKMTLIYTGEDHPLAHYLRKHCEVEVDFAEIFEGPKQGPFGGSDEIRTARAAVAAYLFEMMQKQGYRPKQKQEEEKMVAS